MARSKGYRPRKENKDQLAVLRAELGKLKKAQWQQASRIMHEIAATVGDGTGPTRGKVEPRACKFCGFYGHTSQHCAARKARDIDGVNAEIKRDKAEGAAAAVLRQRQRLRDVPYPGRLGSQEEIFEMMGVRWVRDPIVGPLLALPWEASDGSVR